MFVKRCLHQVFRPAVEIKIKPPAGCGDCSICTPDEQNKLCLKYCEITLGIVDILENEDVNLP